MLDAVADSMLTKPGITPACDVDRESRPHSLSRARTKKGQGEPKYKCTPCVEKRWQKKVVRRPQSASYKSRTEVEARCMKSCLELTRKQIRLAENARTSNLPTNVMALDQLYHKVEVGVTNQLLLQCVQFVNIFSIVTFLVKHFHTFL